MYRPAEPNRTFGVELEIIGVTASQVCRALRAVGVSCADETARYSHTTLSTWKVMTDASVHENYVRGVELVSPILRGKEGVDEVATVVNALKNAGARVNETCGLHVHHGATDLSLNSLKSLVKRYWKAEHFLNVIAGRTQNDYTQSIVKYVNGDHETAFARIDAAESLAEMVTNLRGSHSHFNCRATSGGRCNCEVRYCHLNFGSYWSKGTVEFRHHAGSVDAQEVCAWIVLTQSMIYQTLHTISKNTKSDRFGRARFIRRMGQAHWGNLDPAALQYIDNVLPARVAG